MLPTQLKNESIKTSNLWTNLSNQIFLVFKVKEVCMWKFWSLVLKFGVVKFAFFFTAPRCPIIRNSWLRHYDHLMKFYFLLFCLFLNKISYLVCETLLQIPRLNLQERAYIDKGSNVRINFYISFVDKWDIHNHLSLTLHILIQGMYFVIN